MSDAVVFIIGAIIFAITVWGSVMAGGLRLSRVEVEQNEERRPDVDQDELKKTLPTRMKY